jgi:hypothetical protein
VHNVARESRGPIATINLFEARRAEGLQATHWELNTAERQCVRAPLPKEDEASDKKRWIADCETGY